MSIHKSEDIDVWRLHWSASYTSHPVENRIIAILQESSIDRAISVFLQIINESALRQVNMLWLSRQQKQLIKTNLLPHLGSLVKILESHESEGRDNDEIHWYLQTPDVNTQSVWSDYINDLIDGNKTHIWIYLWRIPNKGMLIKTVNHELNHLFLRYTIWASESGIEAGGINHIFNHNRRFPIILECLWFLWWSESAIISWNFSQEQWLESAEEWSNWDMTDTYTIASVLAKRLLEVQIYFGNMVWNRNSDFIQYCNLVRSTLYRSIFSEWKFNELYSILGLDNKNFSINANMLTRMLDWVWM